MAAPGAHLPGEQVVAERRPQPCRPWRSPGLLPRHDLAVDVLLLERERPLTHVPPLKRERLLGLRSRVCEQAHERGVAVPRLLKQIARASSTAEGARQTTARLRRLEGFVTRRTGFFDTRPRRSAYVNIPDRTASAWRVCDSPTPAASSFALKSSTTVTVTSRSRWAPSRLMMWRSSSFR
jgi:hypothetical protein